MSSFRKALKSRQRNHHERSQPVFRKHLGLLEKKKDYKLRADNYHKKQNTLTALKKKALEKNPDEFYHNMVSSQMKDGVHTFKEDAAVTEEQKKVMRTQDIQYVEMKRVAEARKIERMKASLHLLEADGRQKNQHIFFVDSKKEVQSFNLAHRLNTNPELVYRVYNRPTVDMLKTKRFHGAMLPVNLKKLSKKRSNEYKLLSQRIDREKKLFVISQKIQTRKDLQDKTKRVKVKKETPHAAAIYKFETKRKR
ncbi:probable U3 small nucleolar RNA-associated protein 11 [Dunckerocampus dactyliophorus]|uniref:probable U3 small nucleolar RNA-associated protein 11 n=1 Tax=Dunckerocampus dactyliophorus TaxID=161453 RepID=UPI002405D676|nr:probable U3 small nucleolar RNA-associated protein 11 [Dunckerocampus dactyliophorus]